MKLKIGNITIQHILNFLIYKPSFIFKLRYGQCIFKKFPPHALLAHKLRMIRQIKNHMIFLSIPEKLPVKGRAHPFRQLADLRFMFINIQISSLKALINIM